jgi:hypothetical protein
LFLPGATSSIRDETTAPFQANPKTRFAESWTKMSPSIQEESFENEIATMEDDRTGIKVETLKRAILENLRYVVGKDPEFATEMDYFMAVAYTVRDRILARWLATRRNY